MKELMLDLITGSYGLFSKIILTSEPKIKRNNNFIALKRDSQSLNAISDLD